jgi:hypothetical protein
MTGKLLVILLLTAATYSQSPSPSSGKKGRPIQHQPPGAQQSPTPDQRGSENSPLVVKTIPAPKTPTETEQDAKDREDKAANDQVGRGMAGIMAIIALGQLGVYWYQAVKLKETVASSTEQSKSMEKHIGESARGADAMERIANILKDGYAKQTRAYITVLIGEATYQSKMDGLKFDVKPLVVNTGFSPARNVWHRLSVNILPVPLPDNFDFPLPDKRSRLGIIASQQRAYIMAAVPEYVPEIEVSDIKVGANGMGLYVWGVIDYEDISGNTHYTKFCHQVVWLQPNGPTFWWLTPSHNDAD